MTVRQAADGRIQIRSGWILSMAIALGTLGFVAAAQWNSEVQRTSYTTNAQQTLAGQAIALEEEQALLQAQLAVVEADLADLLAESEGSQTALAQVNEELAATRLAGGLTASGDCGSAGSPGWFCQS